MDTFIAYLIPGIFTGAAYAIAASGLVLTYSRGKGYMNGLPA